MLTCKLQKQKSEIFSKMCLKQSSLLLLPRLREPPKRYFPRSPLGCSEAIVSQRSDSKFRKEREASFYMMLILALKPKNFSMPAKPPLPSGFKRSTTGQLSLKNSAGPVALASPVPARALKKGLES